MKLPKLYKTIGEHRRYNNCRFCFSSNLVPVLDLGNVPLAGGFLKTAKDIEFEKLYPLEISFCKNCYLLQSINVIEADTLFKDYFYHSSAIKTLAEHFTNLTREIKSLCNNKKPFVVEIGCNDGILLKQLINIGIRSLGIDPASNIVKPLIKKGLPIVNDYFSDVIAEKIRNKNGLADVITSSNTFAHIENMHNTVRGIKTLLKQEGIFIFEVHYLGNVLQKMQYDMIYHEHQYYYSLITLKKFFAQYDMEVSDVKLINIHAGSMRYYVQSKKFGKHTVSENIDDFTKKEKNLGFDRIDTYNDYGEKITKSKINLLKLLKDLKSKNKTIAGYGASGRGTTIMNYCGLDKKDLDYVIDDAPIKQGAYTPGTHLRIVSSDILNTKHRPDYVLLFAWSFLEEIKTKNLNYFKNGGKFITPLPQPKII